MIAVVTDSAAMLPEVWRERHRVGVAPMTVVLDGVAYREGIGLTTAEFYRRLADGAQVSTAAPSPGELLAVYEDATSAGAAAVVAVHTGSDYSAVCDASRIAARDTAVPVELVDTHTVSFPVALCVVAAAQAADQGADLPQVRAAAEATVATVDSIFTVGVPELAERSGRFGSTPVRTPTTVLTLGPEGLAEHAQAPDVNAALAVMRDHLAAIADPGRPLRVGVGDADRPDLGAQLADLLATVAGVEEIIRYEVGPSVGAHTGPGTVGAVWAPT